MASLPDCPKEIVACVHLFGTQVTFDDGPGVVVVDGLEVHGLNTEPFDLGMLASFDGNVTHEVFDENGIVVGTLGDGFFVRAFEDAVKLAAGAGLDELDEVLDPNGLVEAHGKGDETALIVSSALADGFGAGAESCNGDFDGDDEVDLLSFCIDLKDDAVVEQAFSLGDGGAFGAEIGEAELDMGLLGMQAGEQLVGDDGNVGDGELAAMGVQDFHKAAHVGAFVLMRQIDGHVYRGDGVLDLLVSVTNAEWEADIFDADAIDGNLAFVTLILRVFERGHGGNKNSHCCGGQQWEE